MAIEKVKLEIEMPKDIRAVLYDPADGTIAQILVGTPSDLSGFSHSYLEKALIGDVVIKEGHYIKDGKLAFKEIEKE